MASLVLILFYSIFKVQIVDAQKYSDDAGRNRIELSYTYPNRGVIYDRNGELLAENIPATQLYLNLKPFLSGVTLDEDALNDELETVYGKLDSWSPPTVEEDEFKGLEGFQKYVRQKIMDRLDSVDDSSKFFVQYETMLIASDLDNSSTISVKSSIEDFAGVVIEDGQKRSYPGGVSFSHILGYTGIITGEDLDAIDYLGYDELVALNSYKDEVGRLGIEAYYDKELSGSKGINAADTDAFGDSSEKLRVVEEQVDGWDLVLTVDAEFQKFLYERLGDALEEYDATSATGIFMDVRSGEIVGMASNPSYNNSDFIGGISNKKYQSYVKDDRNPLLNRTIAAQLPPGSTFKTLTAVGALDAGAIDRSTIYVSRSGYTFSNGASFQDYRGHVYGALNITDALSVSSNIFFCETIRNWDIDQLVPYYERFGIGANTGVDLIGELPGRLPSPDNKIQLASLPEITWLDPIWYPEGDGCNTVIGQGITLVTPLQMANWVSAIANDGILHEPHLVREMSHEDGSREVLAHDANIVQLNRDSTLDIVRAGMHDAVSGPRGTIRALNGSPADIAAKTGTAEFGALNEEGLYEETHAWVTGFFPYDDPKYAFVVVLESGGESYFATQVARDIVDWFIVNVDTLE